MPTPSKGATIPLQLGEGVVIVKPGYVEYMVGAAVVRLFASVTDVRNLVLIEGNRNFLLSPERPDEFVECLHAAMGRTTQSAE